MSEEESLPALETHDSWRLGNGEVDYRVFIPKGEDPGTVNPTFPLFVYRVVGEGHIGAATLKLLSDDDQVVDIEHLLEIVASSAPEEYALACEALRVAYGKDVHV
jgi:hypothetical protein